MGRGRVAAVAAALLSCACITSVPHAAPACDWRMYGHDLARSMSQSDACSRIDPTNVVTLHPKWVFNARAPITAQPAVVDGVVYVGAADGTFYALPADGTGTVEPIWTFTNTDANADSYGKFVSSPAVADVDGRRIVVVGGGSTLYVLDASNGHVVASECFDPRTDPAARCKGSSDIMEIESSPAVVVSGSTAHIYTGMDYNEGAPGRAGILRHTLTRSTDASGHDRWALTPDWKFDPEALVAYTTDVYSAGGAGQGCGNTWSSPTLDAEANLVYFDISNCDVSRYRNHALFGGEAVFAIDATTGALAWCYAPRPVNSEDLDYGATPNLLPDGTVGAGGKDGVYYSFSRLPSSVADTDPATACRGASGQTPRFATRVATPSSVGGIIGTPAVGLVSDPLTGPHDAVFTTNAIPMPDDTTVRNPQHLSTLHAIDARTGEVLWNAPNVFPAYSGPVYANGLVYAPATFGMNFGVYDANTGVPLWSFPMLAPSGPPAIVGDSVYVGSGVEPSPRMPALSGTGVLYAFQAVVN
ncbi:MAG: outer membrane protein assembly factor BamB family protein [Actinomycetota bacterium]